MMFIPRVYVEIDRAAVCFKMAPPMRITTRQKFKTRRVKRKILKAMREFIGQPICDEAKREVEKRIRLTLGKRCPK